MHVYVHMIKLMRSCEYVYLACTGTVYGPIVWLYHTLVWNLLLRSFLNPGQSKSTRFAEAGGKVSCVVGDVNFKTCPELHY